MTFTIKKAFLLFAGIVLASLAQTFASGTEFANTSAFEKHPYLIYTGKASELFKKGGALPVELPVRSTNH